MLGGMGFCVYLLNICPAPGGTQSGKGYDCGLTAVEQCPLRPRWPKKWLCPLLILSAVRFFATNISYQITIVCIQIFLKTSQNNNFVKYDTYNTENSSLLADFKGLFLGIHGKRGL